MAALPSQCSCVDSATRAWERISHMSEISLDTIIIAAAQTIDFSLSSQKCAVHSSASAMEVKDSLLQIYARLVDFLQHALSTYTGTPSTLQVQVPNTPDSGFITPWPVRQMSLESGTQVQTFVHQLGSLQEKQPPALAAKGIVCLPSRMSLGEHELDEQQSKYLALVVLFRTLRNVASVLQQMGGRETAEIRTVDARVLAILLDVTRLVESASAMMHALSG